MFNDYNTSFVSNATRDTSLTLNSLSRLPNNTYTSNTTCGTPLSPDDEKELQFVQWWAGGVIVTIVGLIGIVGNTVSLTAISSLPSHQKSMFYRLLLTLAIFDLVFITTGGLFMVQQAFRFTFRWYEFLFPKFIYPVAAFGMTGKHALSFSKISFYLFNALPQ